MAAAEFHFGATDFNFSGSITVLRWVESNSAQNITCMCIKYNVYVHNLVCCINKHGPINASSFNVCNTHSYIFV